MNFEKKLNKSILHRLYNNTLNEFINNNEFSIIEQLYNHFELFNNNDIASYDYKLLYGIEVNIEKSILCILSSMISDCLILDDDKAVEGNKILDLYIETVHPKTYKLINKLILDNKTKFNYKTVMQVKNFYYISIVLYTKNIISAEEFKMFEQAAKKEELSIENDIIYSLNLCFNVPDIRETKQYVNYIKRAKESFRKEFKVKNNNIAEFISSYMELISNSNKKTTDETDPTLYYIKNGLEQTFIQLAYNNNINQNWLTRSISKSKMDEYFTLACNYNLKYFIQEYEYHDFNKGQAKKTFIDIFQIFNLKDANHKSLKDISLSDLQYDISLLDKANIIHSSIFFFQLIFMILADSSLINLKEVLLLYHRNFSFESLTGKSQLSTLKEKNSTLNAENIQLTNKLKIREEDLIEKNIELNNVINKQINFDKKPLNDEIKSLQKQLDSYEKTITALENKINSQDEFIKLLQEEDINNSNIISDDEFNKISTKRILFLGGRQGTIEELKGIFKNSTFLSNDTVNLGSFSYDNIVVFYKFISHSLYYKYKDNAKLNNIPITYIGNNNLDFIKSMLYKEIINIR